MRQGNVGRWWALMRNWAVEVLCFLGIVIQVVVLVVPRYVARLLGAFQFRQILRDHSILNHFAALRIDRVSDVRIELGAPLLVANGAIILEPQSTLVAVRCSQVILT